MYSVSLLVILGISLLSLTLVPVFGATSIDLWACDSPNDEGGRMYKIDDTDGTFLETVQMVIDGNTAIGAVGDYDFFGGATWSDGCTWLTTDPTDGQMYGILEDGNGDRFLVALDPEAGTGQAIGWLNHFDEVDEAFANHLSIDGDGQMYTSGGQDGDLNSRDIYEVDKTTGVIDPDPVCETDEDSSHNFLALNHDTNVMYMITGHGGFTDHVIFEFDPTDVRCRGSTPIEFSGTTVVLAEPYDYMLGFTYNTKIGEFIILDDDSTPQELRSLTTNGIDTMIQIDFNGFDQLRGIAYTLNTNARPVITIIGDSPTTLKALTGSYIELGATCEDVEDGNLDANVIIGGDIVDVNVKGEYLVTYDCEDSVPQTTIEIRTVIVEELLPVLTPRGNNSIMVVNTVPYVEIKAICLDDEDGNISESVIVGGDVVDTSTVGTYNVTYDCIDSFGQSATPIVTRTVEVQSGEPLDFTDKLWACDDPDGEGGQFYELDQSTGLEISTIDMFINNQTHPDALGIGGSHTGDPWIFRSDDYDEVGAIENKWDEGCPWLTTHPITGVVYGIITDDINDRYLVSFDIENALGQAIGYAESVISDGDLYPHMIAIDGDGTAYVSGGQNGNYQGLGFFTIDLTTGIVDTENPVCNPLETLNSDLNVLAYNRDDGKMYATNRDADDKVIYEVDFNESDCIGSTPVKFDGTTVVLSNPYDSYIHGMTYDTKIGEFFMMDGSSSVQDFRSLTISGVDTEIGKTEKTSNYKYRGITMTLVEQSRPVQTMIGNPTPSLPVGGNYLEEGAICLDEEDGNITGNVVIGGDFVDTDVAGTYYVTYNCADSFPESASQLVRVITISGDITAPVVTVTGGTFQEITVGSTYNELGATATDDIDGNITGSIVTSGDVVDTSTVGVYFVNYTVVDSGGNEGVGVRTVLVVTAGTSSGTSQGGGTVSNPQGGSSTTGDGTGSGGTPDLEDLSEAEIEELLEQLAPSQETTIITEIFQTFFEFRVLDKTHENIVINSFLSDQSLGIQWTSGDDIIVTSIRPAMSPFVFTFEQVPNIKVGSGSAISENSLTYNLDVPDVECTVEFGFDCVEKIRYSVPITVGALINGTEVQATGTILIDLTEDQINPIILILLGTIAIPIIAGILHKMRGGHNPSKVKDLLH